MTYARLSKHGYSQEVRLPKEFRMPGTRVKITRQGKGLLLEPVEDGFNDLFESLSMFSDDFMKEGRDQLDYENRSELFKQ